MVCIELSCFIRAPALAAAAFAAADEPGQQMARRFAVLAGAYIFCVYIQHVSPGAFAAGMTLLTGVGDVVVSG